MHSRPVPSRADFVESLARALRAGRSCLVVSPPGGGAADLAADLAAELDDQRGTASPAMLIDFATDVSEFRDFLQSGDGNATTPTMMVMLAGASLPPGGAELLSAMLRDRSLSVACIVSGQSLRRPQSQTDAATLLDTAWKHGQLERFDVPPMTDAEIRAIIQDVCPAGMLDDLQLQTLITLSEGRPRIASDLANWAAAQTYLVPRRVPLGGIDDQFLGDRSPERLTVMGEGLPRDIQHAAIALSQLSPMPRAAATQLFDAPVIGTLVRLGLARTDGPGLNTVVVSPLIGNALSEPSAAAPLPDWVALDGTLENLYMAGYPVGDAAGLRLARRVMLRPADSAAPQADKARILLQAAQIANRLGDPAEAEMFLAALTGCGDAGHGDTVHGDAVGSSTEDRFGRLPTRLAHTARHQELVAYLIRGDFTRALELGRRALAAVEVESPTTPPDLELLFSVATAIAWARGNPGKLIAPTVPVWWKEFIEGPAAAAYPGAQAVLMACAVGRGVDLEAATRVADDERMPFALRISTLTYLCRYHCNHGDTDALRRFARQGSALIAGLLSGSDLSSDPLTADVIWLFGSEINVNYLVAGLESELVLSVQSSLLQSAVADADAAQTARALPILWGQAIRCALAGELPTAARDAETLAALVNPALLSAAWWQRGNVHRFMGATAPRYGTLFRQMPTADNELSYDRILRLLFMGPGTLNSDGAPAWVRAILLHAQVMDGTLPAEQAAPELRGLASIGLPAPQALRDAVLAVADADPDALLDIGRRLADTNYLAAAEHALTHARSRFLANRATAKANAAGDALQALLHRRDAGRYTPKTHTSGEPVVLTDREFEVCRLIAEGLTNVMISKRLFVSVRTVESHVLSARGKLSAPRRSDIPQRILELQSAGLLRTR